MRVLFVSYPTAFQMKGGGEVQFLETLESLYSLGVEVEMFNQYKIYSRREVDLLHIFSVFKSVELFVDWAGTIGLPYVVSPIHWPDDTDDVERNRIRYILLRAARILPNSFAEMDILSSRLSIPNRDRFCRVVNGVNHGLFMNVKRNPDTIDKKTVLVVANVDRRKNLARLAVACGQLGMRLEILGGVRDRAYFEELLRSANCEIDYLGPFENASEVHLEALSRATVFALPSLYETPGIAAIEAGSAGVPVVVTSVGAAREYFGDGAWYCDPDSITSIASAISMARKTSVMNDSIREIYWSYNWRRAASETLLAYEAALKHE